jgi:phage protein D/phage baseplate assembly protein gpV
MSKPVERQVDIYTAVDGAPVDADVMQHIMEAVVDQHSHMPHMFMLRFHDPKLELLDNGPFDLTKKVKIEASHADGSKVLLIEGEITGIEPQFEEEKPAEFVVRGYDVSHRLYRELKSVSYLNKKDSDLASDIAQKAGLQSKVDATQTVYEHIYQHNQSDLAFLMQRARRIGYECFVDQGTLYFRKPTTDAGNLKLEWGNDLLSFRPSLSLAEQVDEVVVKGWDVEKQAAIIGRAQSGKLYPKIQETKDGAAWAKTFGAGKMVIVDQPVVSQAEADALAAARLDEISGAFIQAEGEAYRRPDVQAGHYVEITKIGKRLSGKYLVTRAIHTYTTQGLRTQFWVSGSRTGSLSEALTQTQPKERWSGLVIGVVTNTDDPKGWCRVKVKFPWMSDDAESDWARLVILGGGPEAGMSAVPAVGDEVVVAFAHGDFSQPFVLGGLWNGKHKAPEQTGKAAQGEKPLIRTWHSREGHSISMYDNADKKIEIKTKDGYTIVLDDKNKDIEIKGPGKLKITMNQDITIEGKANINVKAAGDLTLEATKNLTLKGAQVSIEGNTKAGLKAMNVSVEGSAMTEVKGGLVKIN